MKDLVFRITKEEIFAEVAKASAYVGAKMPVAEGVADPYSRIATVDEDSEMLDAYLAEALTALGRELSREVKGVDMNEDSVTITLRVGNGFIERLRDYVERSLRVYLARAVLAGWFMVTNKEEAAAYAEGCAGMLAAVRSAVYQRERPEKGSR